MIRIELPYHLCTLAGTGVEITVEVDGLVTQRTVLNAVENEFPMLRGLIRDPITGIRRPYLRIFACQTDLSHDAPDEPLPELVARGLEPLIVLGAVAGG